MRRLVLASLLLALPLCAEPTERTIEVEVQRARGDNWDSVDARTVFHAGEQIRFRFRSTFDGYLYVLDQTGAGAVVWLYPDPQTGLNNQVRAGEWNLVPSTNGAFGIPATAGFETIYWIVSPDALRDLTPDRIGPRASAPKTTMVPRCEEGVLKARGACLDRNAGPKPVSDAVRLQRLIGSSASLSSRDIYIQRKANVSVLKIRSVAERSLVYEFWIAHQ